MSGRRVSIGQVMIVIALTAVNLAVARGTPWEILTAPTVWIAMGILDFLVVWKLILRRTFRAFQYTVLVVLVVAFPVMANLVAVEAIHPLALPVRWYYQLSGKNTESISLLGYVGIGEFWTVAFISFALACAVGWVAAWLERHRGWDIAAFWRGALLGLVVVTLAAMVDDAARGWVPLETYSIRWAGRMVLLGTGLILGGWMGLSRLRSSRSGPKDQIG